MESESNNDNSINVTSPEPTPFTPSSFEKLNAVWNESCIFHKDGLEPFLNPIQDFRPDVKVSLFEIELINGNTEYKEKQQKILYMHSIVMAGASRKLKDLLSTAPRNGDGQKELTFRNESMDALLCFSLLFYCPHVIELVDYQQLKPQQMNVEKNIDLSLSTLANLWMLAKVTGCTTMLNHLTVYLILDLCDVERNSQTTFVKVFEKLTKHVSNILVDRRQPTDNSRLYIPCRYFCHTQKHMLKAGAVETPHDLICEPELANTDMLTYWVLDTLVSVQQNHYWALLPQITVHNLELLEYMAVSYINQLSFCNETRKSGILLNKWHEFVVFFTETISKFAHGQVWIVWIDSLMKIVADHFFFLLVVEDHPRAANEQLVKFTELIELIQSKTHLNKIVQSEMIQFLHEWTPVTEIEEEEEEEEEEKQSQKKESTN